VSSLQSSATLGGGTGSTGGPQRSNRGKGVWVRVRGKEGASSEGGLGGWGGVASTVQGEKKGATRTGKDRRRTVSTRGTYKESKKRGELSTKN